MRARRASAVVGVIALLAIGLGLAGCTPAATDAGSTTETSEELTFADVCARAEWLLGEEEPEAAIALITQHRQPAIDRLEAGASSDEDADRDLADDCEDQWSAALEYQAKDADASWAEKAGQAWKEWTKAYPVALVPLVAGTLAIFGALVIAARLLAYAVPSRRRRVDSSQLPKWGVWSLILLVLASLLPALQVAWMHAVLPWAWFLILETAIAIAGVIALARWLGARARVSCRVTDSTGTPSITKSADLARLVVELGAARRGGIEIPGASDITQLADAASKVSTNAVLTFFIAVWQFISNIAPWQVDVHVLDEKSALVRVGWNARQVAEERVTAQTLELDDDLVKKGAVLHFAAAIVATEMAQKYRDMTGLYGATDWRSVGLHDIARTILKSDHDAAKKRLARAFALDPNNLLAETALRNYEHRQADGAELNAYRETLEELAGRVAKRSGYTSPFGPDAFVTTGRRYPDPPVLLRRILNTWVAVVRNLVANEGTPDFVPDNARESRAVAALVALLEKDPPAEVLRQHELVRMTTGTSVRRLEQAGRYRAPLLPAKAAVVDAWYTGAKASTLPDVAYSHACQLAQSAPVRKPELDAVKALVDYRADLAAHRERAAAYLADRESYVSRRADPTRTGSLAHEYAELVARGTALNAESLLLTQRRPAVMTEPALEAATLLWTIGERLKVAKNRSNFQQWAPKDPELVPIRESHWSFLHPDAATSTMDVAPLSKHKVALSAVGVSQAKQLAARAGDRQLRKHLKLDSVEFTYLVDVALLGALIESKSGSEFDKRVPEIFRALLAADVVSPMSLLSALRHNETRVKEAVAEAILGIGVGNADPWTTLRDRWRA